MWIRLAVEAVCYTLAYTLVLLVIFEVQGAKGQLYNYPPSIQKRAIERGITTREEMNAYARKNKPIGFLMMTLLCLLIICVVNRQNTFLAGFVQSYLFLNIFSQFDALVLDTIWFCHSKWWVIPGTEDMAEAYHDYAFHWKWFFIGLPLTLPLAAMIGGIAALIGIIL